MVSAPTACASAKWLRGQTRRPETGLGAQLHLIALNCTSLRWGCRREAVSLAAPRAGDPPGGTPHVSRFTHRVSRFPFPVSRIICQSSLRLLRLCYAFCYGSKVSKPLIPLVCYDCYGFLPQGHPPPQAPSLGPSRTNSAARPPSRQRSPLDAIYAPSIYSFIQVVSALCPPLSGLFRPFPGPFRAIPAFSSLIFAKGVGCQREDLPASPALHVSRITYHASRITHHT